MQALMGNMFDKQDNTDVEADFNNFEDNDEELQTNFGCEECKTFTLVYQSLDNTFAILD